LADKSPNFLVISFISNTFDFELEAIAGIIIIRLKSIITPEKFCVNF